MADAGGFEAKARTLLAQARAHHALSTSLDHSLQNSAGDAVTDICRLRRYDAGRTKCG